MDFGLGVMGYHGCWDDVGFAEQHGFATAGFVDSPLLGGETFAVMALAAQATSTIRLGTFLAVPSNRNAPLTAQGVATINRLAPGRVFLGLGTGYTARNTFGLPPVAAARMRDYALECRGLLTGGEVVHRVGAREQPIRFAQQEGTYIDLEHPIPIYVAADGPKALAAAGESGDGWVTSLQFANVMANAVEVFSGSLAAARAAAEIADRPFADPYTMWSTGICVLDEGESAVSPRALEQVGAVAMMAFHSYADNPAIAEYLPPPFQDRIEVYEREVLARFDGPRDRIYQHVHRGHLSHLQPGEAEVLTEDIVRATTLTGTIEEIAGVLGSLEAAGLRNVTTWIPPHLTRKVVLEIEERLMPHMA